MPALRLTDPQLLKLREFCERYGVRELSLFGSALRDDFAPESDVDVLLEFAPGRGFTFENTPDILDGLAAIFGHDVDVAEKGTITNPFRRSAILGSARVVYAA
jgi:predicted nucleotidyltransferase